jgi:hypothetical protein
VAAPGVVPRGGVPQHHPLVGHRPPGPRHHSSVRRSSQGPIDRGPSLPLSAHITPTLRHSSGYCDNAIDHGPSVLLRFPSQHTAERCAQNGRPWLEEYAAGPPLHPRLGAVSPRPHRRGGRVGGTSAAALRSGRRSRTASTSSAIVRASTSSGWAGATGTVRRCQRAQADACLWFHALVKIADG